MSADKYSEKSRLQLVLSKTDLCPKWWFHLMIQKLSRSGEPVTTKANLLSIYFPRFLKFEQYQAVQEQWKTSQLNRKESRRESQMSSRKTCLRLDYIFDCSFISLTSQTEVKPVSNLAMIPKWRVLKCKKKRESLKHNDNKDENRKRYELRSCALAITWNLFVQTKPRGGVLLAIRQHLCMYA